MTRALLILALMIFPQTMAAAQRLQSANETKHTVGTASFYGEERQGRLMANGKPFDYHKLTMACWSLPLGSRVRVTNLANGRSVIVVVTDRGPAHRLERVADLSKAAALRLGFVRQGLTCVELNPIPKEKTKNGKRD